MNRDLIQKIRAEHLDSRDAEILATRKVLLNKIRSVSKKGEKVEYLGREFVVFPGVFQPWHDSMPLVKNYEINQGERVLDVGTGSGIIAIFAAAKGARRVYATDIDPVAVKAAAINAYLHGYSDVIETKQANVLPPLKEIEIFDVITGNLPFTHCGEIKNSAERTVYDHGFDVHRKFFKIAEEHLSFNGRIYLAQANFGNCENALKLADRAGFDARLIGEKKLKNDKRRFYAFELKRKK